MYGMIVTGELFPIVAFNEISSHDCASNWQYNAEAGRFEFEIQLGECGMKSEIANQGDKSYIKFTENVSVTQTNSDIFLNGGTLYRFSCYYSTTTTTMKERYSVNVQHKIARTIEGRV